MKKQLLTRLLLALFFVISLQSCKKQLYTGLSEQDANAMMAILLQNNIKVSKTIDSEGLHAITIDTDQLPAAVNLLKQNGYPKEAYQSMGELFKKEGLISSPLEERVRFIYALSQNVEETLSQIDGVITARVHVVIPENNPFAEEIKPASASVFIKYRPESGIKDNKSDIKLIVEKSIEGLSYDKVSVVMLPGQKYEGSYTKEESGYGIFSFLSWLVFFTLLISVVVYFYQTNQKEKTKKKDPNKKPDTTHKPVGQPKMPSVVARK